VRDLSHVYFFKYYYFIILPYHAKHKIDHTYIHTMELLLIYKKHHYTVMQKKKNSIMINVAAIRAVDSQLNPHVSRHTPHHVQNTE